MTFANQVKQTLNHIISEMAQSPGLFSYNPKSDFSFDPNTPTNSAFYQQHSKLLPETFPFLFHEFNAAYPFTFYKGKYQLLACDGSSFTFTRNPDDPDSYFPPNGKTTNGYNQIHAVTLFDLLSKRYCDCIVQPVRKKNEFQALYTLIDRYHAPSGKKPIFIADRGFHSFNAFAHAIEHESYFLIRAKNVNMMRLLGTDIPENSQNFDIQVNRILTRIKSKKKRLHPKLAEQYRLICKNVTFDYIDPEKKNEYPISLRLLRFKISEDGYENIITNLPASEFSAEEIKMLYNLR